MIVDNMMLVLKGYSISFVLIVLTVFLMWGPALLSNYLCFMCTRVIYLSVYLPYVLIYLSNFQTFQWIFEEKTLTWQFTIKKKLAINCLRLKFSTTPTCPTILNLLSTFSINFSKNNSFAESVKNWIYIKIPHRLFGFFQ